METAKHFVINNIPMTLDVSAPGVFRPSIISIFIAENLQVERESRVLDIGSGSGFLGILAAKLGAGSVLGIDKNATVIEPSKKNAERNDVPKKCEFRCSDLFSAVDDDDIFDLIVSNPPSTPTDATQRKDRGDSTDGGPNGNEVILGICDSAVKHLSPKGRLVIPIPGWSSPLETKRNIAKNYCMEKIVSIDLPVDFNNYYIIQNLDKLQKRGVVAFKKRSGMVMIRHTLYSLMTKYK